MAKKCPETKNIVPEIVPKKKKIYLHEKCPKVSQNIQDILVGTPGIPAAAGVPPAVLTSVRTTYIIPPAAGRGR